MAFFSGDRASTVVSWIAGRASLVVDLPRSCLEHIYRKACDIENRRQLNEIIVFGWTITLHADGTALAENDLTGAMMELDAEQAADIKWTADEAMPIPRRSSRNPHIQSGLGTT
jgi:hypothetical protein